MKKFFIAGILALVIFALTACSTIELQLVFDDEQTQPVAATEATTEATTEAPTTEPPTTEAPTTEAPTEASTVANVNTGD
ncbi:MAG: hypothetical protein IJT27_08810 [Clostridia bacterium]|nr:hypothetical protein [Clostridia bacterium]